MKPEQHLIVPSPDETDLEATEILAVDEQGQETVVIDHRKMEMLHQRITELRVMSGRPAEHYSDQSVHAAILTAAVRKAQLMRRRGSCGRTQI